MDAAQHEGHERLHNILILVSLAFLVVSQVVLYWWRHTYPKSYRQVTLIGLWLLPIAASIWFKFWRMIVTWAVYTVSNFVVIHMARARPLPKETPRKVYIFYFLIYKITYALSVIGYTIIMAEFMGVTHAIASALGASPSSFRMGGVAVMLLFYGLYYGVLNRDIAEVVTDKLASRMGICRTRSDIPVRQFDRDTCLLCTREFNVDKTISLPNCNHTFHEFCIRGWTIVGKKDTCPYCNEKVNLSKSFKNPWEKHSLMWSQLLDAVRHLVVWNPLILLCVDLLFYLVDVPNPVTSGIHNS